jgi:hypothetical protein
MCNDNSRLQRFGALLLDPRSVIAVVPILGNNDASTVYGFRILTTGGELEVTDRKAGEAVRSYFYEPNHISPVFDRLPVPSLQSSVSQAQTVQTRPVHVQTQSVRLQPQSACG